MFDTSAKIQIIFTKLSSVNMNETFRDENV